MAKPRAILPHLLVVACFSRHDEALDWGKRQLEGLYGPICLSSEPYAFHQTAYYEPTMGRGLRKVCHAFRELVNPEVLPDVKRRTNGLELELAFAARFAESRPLNLDPGLLTLGKFLLATTKDQAHRIYLRDAIFAEVTLRFEAGSYHPWPWTYADYRQPEVIAFLNQAREAYKELLRQRAAGD